MMDPIAQDDFYSLLQELENIKLKQSGLNAREEACKAELMEIMKDHGIEKESSDAHGSIRIQRKVEKDYGPQLRDLEIAYKEAKKLADDMGDFEIMNVKETLVYTPPKDIVF